MTEYLTIPEVAVLWRLSAQEVRRLCETHFFYGVIQLRKRWLIPKESVAGAWGDID